MLPIQSRAWSLRKEYSTMVLTDTVFALQKKKETSNILNDLIIYQHDKKNPGNRRVIRARKGEMLKTADGRYLSIHLMDGVSYDEVGGQQEKNHPQIKSTFKEDYIMMDLSGFDMQRTDEDLWKNHMKMMSMEQLSYSIDSLQRQKDNRKTDFVNYMEGAINLPDSADLVDLETETAEDTTATFGFTDLSPADQRRAVNVAMNMTRNAKNYMNRTAQEMDNREEYLDKHKIEWHRKLTLSFACIVLFFIGAPLGAIIKKGGLGLPVIFSVVFFLIFHITSITGEKLIESGKMSPFTGMWFSSMVLLPIALFLTYKAVKDAALFDRDTYSRFVEKLTARFMKKNVHQV